MPHFCVSVAVEGRTGCSPASSTTRCGTSSSPPRAGEGATLNGQPIQPSSIERLDRALLCTGFPYDVREHPEGPVGLFTRFIDCAQGIRRMGSAALDLAYVAAGRFDGFFEFGLKPWDIAAGVLICSEAGAVATRIDGASYDTSVIDVLAASPGISAPLQRECRRFLDEIGWKPTAFH